MSSTPYAVRWTRGSCRSHFGMKLYTTWHWTQDGKRTMCNTEIPEFNLGTYSEISSEYSTVTCDRCKKRLASIQSGRVRKYRSVEELNRCAANARDDE
jgi:hypothetical protein